MSNALEFMVTVSVIGMPRQVVSQWALLGEVAPVLRRAEVVMAD